MTDVERRALEIVARYGPIMPREFAALMWPDSPGWKRHSKCGPKGVSQGGGMRLAAGGYLGRLRKRGLVNYVRLHAYSLYFGYAISAKGKSCLEK